MGGALALSLGRGQGLGRGLSSGVGGAGQRPGSQLPAGLSSVGPRLPGLEPVFPAKLARDAVAMEVSQPQPATTSQLRPERMELGQIFIRHFFYYNFHSG